MLKIALIGSTGMLGIDVNAVLKSSNFTLKNYNSKNLDITDAQKVNETLRAFSPDYVINCAAYSNVDGAEIEKDKADKVNNVGVKNIAEAVLPIGSRIIHISSDYIFGGGKTSDKPYTEDDNPQPINEYGLSKLRGEESLKESGASYTILRTSWLYGKNGKNFVNTILKLADTRNTIEVVDDQVGSPTYTKDIAYAIYEILLKDNSKNEIYNLTNSGEASWYKFAVEIINIFKRTKCEIVPISSEKLKRPAPRPSYSVLDNSKIKEDYGIELRQWKDALRKYCNDIGYFIV